MAEEQQDSGYFTSIPHGAEWLGQFGLFYSLNAVEEVSFPFWAQFLLKNWHSSVFSIGGEKHIFFWPLFFLYINPTDARRKTTDLSHGQIN